MSASITEGVAARVIYKFSASGIMATNALPVPSSDPGASGGQVLRRVSSDLDLVKNTFVSNEVRSDRQIFDLRHASQRVQGGITGELSPGTYQDFFQALTRGTWGTANSTLLPATYTSVAADNPSSTLIFAGGDPVVTGGVRIGSFITLTGTGLGSNANTLFMVTAVGGVTNRTLTVYPAPATVAASTTFTATLTGRRLFVPSTGQVNRKLTVEHCYDDVDLSRLFLDCRVTGMQLSLQPDQAANLTFSMMGRAVQTLNNASSPFFTAPTAETTTSVVASVGGVVMAAGVQMGVATGINLQVDMAATAPAVIGQNFPANVFVGRFNMTGTLTVLFDTLTNYNLFVNETEFAILGLFTSGTALNSPSVSLYMPRCKATAGTLPLTGEAEQTLTLPFQALKAIAAPGVEATTFQIVDSAAV